MDGYGMGYGHPGHWGHGAYLDHGRGYHGYWGHHHFPLGFFYPPYGWGHHYGYPYYW
jgi:hypothetical protein